MKKCVFGPLLAVLPWCAYADQQPGGLAVTLGPAYEFVYWAGPRAMMKDGDGGGFSIVSPHGNAVECFDAAMKKPKRYEFPSEKGKYIETVVVNPDDVRSVNITRKKDGFILDRTVIDRSNRQLTGGSIATLLPNAPKQIMERSFEALSPAGGQLLMAIPEGKAELFLPGEPGPAAAWPSAKGFSIVHLDRNLDLVGQQYIALPGELEYLWIDKMVIDESGNIAIGIMGKDDASKEKDLLRRRRAYIIHGKIGSLRLTQVETGERLLVCVGPDVDASGAVHLAGVTVDADHRSPTIFTQTLGTDGSLMGAGTSVALNEEQTKQLWFSLRDFKVGDDNATRDSKDQERDDELEQERVAFNLHVVHWEPGPGGDRIFVAEVKERDFVSTKYSTYPEFTCGNVCHARVSNNGEISDVGAFAKYLRNANSDNVIGMLVLADHDTLHFVFNDLALTNRVANAALKGTAVEKEDRQSKPLPVCYSYRPGMPPTREPIAELARSGDWLFLAHKLRTNSGTGYTFFNTTSGIRMVRIGVRQ